MNKKRIILILVLLVGVLIGTVCHAKRSETYIPRECLISVEFTDKSECVIDKDGSWTCHKFKVEHIKGCERVRVK